ncbi:MAG: phenylalanine--tRNA ligase subunit alpha [Candidatus Algichlamydia australiensis]|nr:phenylalanine--tRNA ligase subunit alpha [Chlamydiales bacterium]
MLDRIQKLKESYKSELDQVKKSRDLEDLKVKYLGRKGPIQALMQSLRDMPADQRPQMGKVINELKQTITLDLDDRLNTLIQQERNAQISSESVDISLPGRKKSPGRIHPLSQMMDEILAVLIEMGFTVQETPEIESEYYNYGGLNYPPDHPARDMQDTFYLAPEILLRSHNTNVQQRVMEHHNPPIRICSHGKCYRNETITSRSHVLFHQVDVLYIDKNVSFADLLATKKAFFEKLLGHEVELRVRPSYFPFVEPGMEVDIRCTSCQGKGCRLCKETGWLEVSGAGMVHPEVLKEGGVDPEHYSGFAWGGGVERLFMLRHGVTDIRLFTDNDMRFLSQF